MVNLKALYLVSHLASHLASLMVTCLVSYLGALKEVETVYGLAFLMAPLREVLSA